MTSVPLELGERVVDGSPDQGMDEPDRLLRPEHVDPDEGRDRLGGCAFVKSGELRGLAWIGVVTEHRNGLGQCRRLRRKPCEPQRDGARAGARLELAQVGHVRLGWHDPFDGDRVHASLREAPGHLPRHAPQHALQLADARLARVAADDAPQRLRLDA